MQDQMEVRRVYNPQLVASILSQPAVMAKIAEDDEAYELTDYVPLLDGSYAIAMLNADVLHGILLAQWQSSRTLLVTAVIDSARIEDKVNVPLARLAIRELFLESGAYKIVSHVPRPDTETLRFLQRVGFQREGVNKSSFLRNGTMLDQYYVGLTRD